MSQIKYPSVSKETANKITGNKWVRTVSQIPYDKYDCKCKPLVENYFKQVANGQKPDYVECNHHHEYYNQYEIICNNCNNVVANCWSSDGSLSDYFDLHYVCENNGKNWRGAMSLNISPIDGKLGIECACGQDTRDFRANNTLPLKEKNQRIIEGLKGREFGKGNSKFLLKLKK